MWEFLAVYHHPDNFRDHGHCERGDIFLTCYVTPRDNMFKGFYITLWIEAFHGESTPCQIDGYWSFASGDIKY